jgi:hypothetical protein
MSGHRYATSFFALLCLADYVSATPALPPPLAVFTQCLTHVSLAGSGKTLIAALLIKDKIKEIKAQGKSVAFLAPTVPLVLQVRHQLQPVA